MSVPRDQHFLIDRRAIKRIVSLVDVEARTVLEIGPGTGNLTKELLNAGAHVIAVEVDRALCEDLEMTFSQEIKEGRLALFCGDASRMDLPPFDIVVANLPYSLSSRITFRLLDIGFEEAVLMYQKEFAQRMLAPIGTPECGRLSVMVQTYACVSPCFELSPNSFSPKPQVRSMVVRLVPHTPPYAIRDRKRYADTVRILFSHRRKTVRNGLRSAARSFGKETVASMLSVLPEELLAKRPEELKLEEFAAIANVE